MSSLVITRIGQIVSGAIEQPLLTATRWWYGLAALLPLVTTPISIHGGLIG